LETADQLKDPRNFGQLIQQHLARRQRTHKQAKAKRTKRAPQKPKQKLQKEQKKGKPMKSRAAVHKKQVSKSLLWVGIFVFDKNLFEVWNLTLIGNSGYWKLS
jgi:putative methionine-R-sulfoxide reductase with GAF domain